METRRSCLAAIGCLVSTTVAGCSSSSDDDSDGDGGGGSGRQEIDTFSADYTIREDAWKGQSITLEQQSTIEWDAIVRTDFAVDIIVLEESEYEPFQNGERFEYMSAASRLDTVGDEVSATLPSGEYKLIVDNSDYGEATPPSNLDGDPADVEIEGGLYA